MVTGFKISNKKSMSLKNKLNEYLNPEYVYIPLISGLDTNISIFVKKNDYVYKGTVLGKRQGNFSIPILSSVSGTVIGFEEKYYINGEKIKCVVIQNDFKELVEKKEPICDDITKISKADFITILKNNSIVGLGGANFPTFAKYDTDKKIKTLIVNAVECEPYITADYTLVLDHAEEILECVNAILKINGISEAYIAVKRTNTKIINAFDKYIGTFPNIKIYLMPNLYPMGWEKSIVIEILKKPYDKLPIEVNTVVNNVSTIYAIYESLKYNKPLISRIVTFTGEGLDKPLNIKLKFGTLASEVIKKYCKYKNSDDLLFIAGGPMMGEAIKTDDLVITPNLNCVLVLPKLKKSEQVECLRCGLCVKYCPAKLAPVLIKNDCEDFESLKKYEVNRCIECGLCSYVCPSKIRVRDYVQKAKDTIRKENK